jgi:uncharacterized protein (DUF2267 family)
MDELIPLVVSKLNLDEAQVKTAIGAVLKFLSEQSSDSFDFEAILSKLPGAADLMNDDTARAAVVEGEEEAKKKSSGPSGIIGLVFLLLKAFGVMAILKNLLSTFFGENAVKLLESVEDGAELTAVMSKLGMSRDQGIKVVRMVVDFMKDKVDAETIEKLTGQIPALKAFLSESKKDE